MPDYKSLFEQARAACAKRLSAAIKTFIDDTPKGKLPDTLAAISGSLVVELTHMCARIAVLEAKLEEMNAVNTATNERVLQVLEHLKQQKENQ